MRIRINEDGSCSVAGSINADEVKAAKAAGRSHKPKSDPKPEPEQVSDPELELEPQGSTPAAPRAKSGAKPPAAAASS